MILRPNLIWLIGQTSAFDYSGFPELGTTTEPFTMTTTDEPLVTEGVYDKREIVDEATANELLALYEQSTHAKRYSALLSMMDFFASKQDLPINYSERFNYGCNCYGDNVFPDFDSASFGQAVDDYDKTCLEWKRCRQRVLLEHTKDAYGNACNINTQYQFSKFGNKDGAMDQKSVTCNDNPCSCSRFLCECDKVFIRANTIAFEAEKFNPDMAAGPYFKKQIAASNFAGLFLHLTPSICKPHDGGYVDEYVPTPNYPCMNPLVENLSVADSAMKFTVYNYNHDYQEAVDFCVSQGQKLLPLDSSSVSVLTEIGSKIADLNSKFGGDVRLWTPYKFNSVEKTWSSEINSKRQCSNSMLWVDCSTKTEPDESGICATFSYSVDQNNLCRKGMEDDECTKKADSDNPSRYTVCTSDYVPDLDDSGVCMGEVKCNVMNSLNKLYSEEPDIFTADYQQKIKDEYDTQVGSGINFVDTDRNDFVKEILWDAIKNERTDESTKIQEWLGSADFVKFELALEFMCGSASSSGRRRRNTDEDNIINQILNMDVCPAFASDYDAKWDEFMTSLGTPDQAMTDANQELAKNVGALPSRYILLQYILDFLWTVPLVDGSSPVEFSHLDYAMKVRPWVLDTDNDMAIDRNDLVESTKTWLLATITQYSQTDGSFNNIVNDLNGWAANYNGNSELLTKYGLVVDLETDRTPCGDTEETVSDKVMKKVLALNLEASTDDKSDDNQQEFQDLVKDIYTSEGATPPTDQSLEILYNQAVIEEVTEDQFSPCPSADCWQFNTDTQTCTLLDDIVCRTLTCEHDKLVISFDSALFGIDDDSANDFAEGACFPKWSSSNNKWELEVPLGTCNMAIKTTDDDSNLRFSHKVMLGEVSGSSTKYWDFTSESLIDIMTKGNSGGISVDFFCKYDRGLVVTSQAFGVNKPSASGNANNLDSNNDPTGSLDAGFSIALYDSEQFDVLADLNEIFLGTFVYVQVNWSVSTLLNKVQFIVNKCQVQQTASPSPIKVKVVEDNCYAAAVGAKILTDHQVDQQSRFSYRTFIAGDGNDLSYEEVLSCEIRMCLQSEDCKLTTNDNDCPLPDSNYDFKVNGAV